MNNFFFWLSMTLLAILAIQNKNAVRDLIEWIITLFKRSQ